MIRTRLPYNIEEFDNIAQNGAIVDISNPEFEGIAPTEKNKTILIYLRNTGFDVTLDFSNVNEEDKFELLKTYIEDDIECKDIQLRDTWIKLISNHLSTNCNTSLQSILTLDEEKAFMQQNSELVDKLCNVCASLSLFLMLRLKDAKIDFSGVEEDNTSTVGVNFVNLLTDDLIVNASNSSYPLTNYTKIFTMQNNMLFDTLKMSVLGFILHMSKHMQ